MSLIKELREALMDAFRNQNDLEKMLREELNWNLNSKAGGNNYEQIVYNLIDKVESEGELTKLVEAAITRNPGNPRLFHFKNNYFNSVTQDEINNLKLRLNKIDFQNIKNIYKQILPDNAIRDNIEFCEPKNIDDVIKVLCNDYPKNDVNIPSIIQLVERIVNTRQENSAYYQELIDYLNLYLSRFKIEISQHCNSNIGADEFDSHLVLIVNPEGRKFCLEAIICNQDKYLKPLDYVSKSQSKLRKGILCSQKAISQEITKIIDYFLENVNPTLRIIEVYLPNSLLYTDVDNWHILNDYKKPMPILRKFDIVVHASERIAGRNNFRFLTDGWKTLKDFLSSEPTQDVILKKIETVNQIDEVNWDKIEKKLKDKICMKLNKPLLESETEQEKFIHVVLSEGVPFVFWLKRQPSANVDLEQINCYLTLEDLNNNLNKLIQNIYTMRCNAYNSETPEDELGYHLGFWCDIPDKIRKIQRLQYPALKL
jgi:Effector-associated domain 1/vWA-MoxR associated protein C-terminal domain